MSEALHFFFYGTLVAGSDNPVARAIHALLEPLGPATTRGALHAIPDPAGWFPALLPGDGLVHGALYRARPTFDAAALARMDAYEDYDPAHPGQSLYCRVELAISGGADAAQAYLWNRALPSGAEPIPGGNFAEWLAEGERQAFGGRHGSS